MFSLSRLTMDRQAVVTGSFPSYPPRFAPSVMSRITTSCRFRLTGPLLDKGGKNVLGAMHRKLQYMFCSVKTVLTIIQLTPPPPPIIYRLGWPGLAGYRFCFVFRRSPTVGRRVRSFVRGREPLLRTRKMIVSRSVHGKAPKRQFHSAPIAVSGSGYTGI